MVKSYQYVCLIRYVMDLLSKAKKEEVVIQLYKENINTCLNKNINRFSRPRKVQLVDTYTYKYTCGTLTCLLLSLFLKYKMKFFKRETHVKKHM